MIDFFFSSRRRHTRSVTTNLLNRSSDLVTTNLLKFMRASIKMIGVSNLQSFIEARINLSRFVVTRSEERFSRNAETDIVCRLLFEKKKKTKASQVIRR